MFHQLPRLALQRFSRPLVQSSSRVSLSNQTRTPLRLASTHSAAHAAKHDDHGHGHGGHDDHFDPPGGWLWGERPGDKYEKEGWEPFAWFFVASWVVAVAAYTMKEDTSYVLPNLDLFPRRCSYLSWGFGPKEEAYLLWDFGTNRKHICLDPHFKRDLESPFR
ncbi:hypothetical protein A1O3_08923 [Capronia epimyces CBS 606.96]|uniref:NADH dehydrogenase [ubiquinone] 1 beta subcomplex subunit 11, mitochondrial n=1 Tax=Capronia epimyces CBS 606.96 TaxID=1182542 RepID=W9XR37_9EURO|nr:uncharacterized protein A1O3_08923 [Capronia epimyces CBS 606.96]EXJ79421.1 hypothetical protein A1O3_08923 [Capronia epimyces CBS 606.96]